MGEIKIICRPIGTKAEPEVEDFLSKQELRLLEDLKWKGFSADYDNVTVGVLLYRVQENYIVLERIFVKPGYRRNGIGTEMLEMLCKFAKVSKKRLLFSFDATGNRDAFYRFVASTHLFFIERQEGFEAYLTENEVLNIGRKNTLKIDNTELFFEQKNSVKKEFIAHLEKSYEQIAWELQYDNKAYRKDLSCCVIEKGVIQAISLIKEAGEELELKLMYGRSGKGNQTAKALLSSFQLLKEENVLPMRIAPVSDAEIKILNFICPEYEITKRFYVAYYMGS